jgi:hypothetical protein
MLRFSSYGQLTFEMVGPSDAVIAHELAESQTGTHDGAEALAAERELSVSEGTRRILRAMVGRLR